MYCLTVSISCFCVSADRPPFCCHVTSFYRGPVRENTPTKNPGQVALQSSGSVSARPDQLGMFYVVSGVLFEELQYKVYISSFCVRTHSHVRLLD